MARNISDIVNFIQYLVRKERGIFIQPNQCTANLDAAQLDLVEELFKGYGENQTLHDGLRQFRVYYQFTSDAAGFVTYPSNYLHILGTAFTVTGSTVNEISPQNEDQFINAMTSQLRRVSLSRPIAKDTSAGFSIYPQSLQIGFFNYLRRPETPVYDYTQVGRVITYNPGTSTQLEWTDAYINNLIAKSLRYAGINMNEKDVSGYADYANKETQP